MRYSQQQILPEDGWAVAEVLRSEFLTQGPKVEEFESALAEYVGAKYCVAVNSGTAALHVAYQALVEIGGPTCFLVPALTFVATANAALMSDSGVTFLDVHRWTGNVEGPDRTVHRGMTEVAVHMAGRPARAWNARIEDACHALGGRDWDDCSMIGSCKHSLATCFSFHPVKPITTGEGGAVTTNSEQMAEVMRELRSHGRSLTTGLMHRLGLNYRMPEMSAALGLAQLKRCEFMRARRAELALEYWDRLVALGSPNLVIQGNRSHKDAWHLYPIHVLNGFRDEVLEHLRKNGIHAQVHYSPIVPAHPYYRSRGANDQGFPGAEEWARTEISLPLHSGMTSDDVKRVCATLEELL